MPKLSVWLVRAALIQMGVGFLLGALILFHKGIPIYDWMWKLLTPHIEIMIFGWTIQFIMGVGYWVLPRFPGNQRYGRTWLGWLSFALINLSVLIAGLGGWFDHDVLLIAGRVSGLAAILAFILMMWPRIKPIALPPSAKERFAK